MLPHPGGESLRFLQITATRLVLDSLIELAAASVLIWRPGSWSGISSYAETVYNQIRGICAMPSRIEGDALVTNWLFLSVL